MVWEGRQRIGVNKNRVVAPMKPVTTIVVVVFALVAVVHLIRIIQGWEVIVNGITMPLWVSVVGAIIAGGLAILLWREARG